MCISAEWTVRRPLHEQLDDMAAWQVQATVRPAAGVMRLRCSTRRRLLSLLLACRTALAPPRIGGTLARRHAPDECTARLMCAARHATDTAVIEQLMAERVAYTASTAQQQRLRRPSDRAEPLRRRLRQMYVRAVETAHIERVLDARQRSIYVCDSRSDTAPTTPAQYFSVSDRVGLAMVADRFQCQIVVHARLGTGDAAVERAEAGGTAVLRLVLATPTRHGRAVFPLLFERDTGLFAFVTNIGALCQLYACGKCARPLTTSRLCRRHERHCRVEAGLASTPIQMDMRPLQSVEAARGSFRPIATLLETLNQ